MNRVSNIMTYIKIFAWRMDLILSCHTIMHVPPLIFIKDIFYLNYLIGKRNYAPGDMNHCKCFFFTYLLNFMLMKMSSCGDEIFLR